MILIKNAILITQDRKRRLIERGALVIEGDLIKAVGTTKTVEKEFGQKAKKIFDAKECLVMPGLINTHTHLAMSLLRGYADDMDLQKWWFNKIHPAESRFSRKEVLWGSLLSMVEMIESGTTCFVDFYYFEDEVAKAAKKMGLRGILGSGVLDMPTFAFKNSSQALKDCPSRTVLEGQSLVEGAIAPHMMQTTSLRTYKRCRQMADKKGWLLTTHLLETKEEISFCFKKYQKRPLEVMFENGILTPKTILAHVCWPSKKEISLLARSGASVSHCPASNMKLASGTMPLPAMQKKGVNISLGTDGSCSNNNLDMFEEMKIAALIHKSHWSDPTVAIAQTALDMATINGARALGKEKELGSLEPGKKADIIILSFEKAHLLPLHHAVSHLVYSAKGSDVETVIVDGKIIMEKRKIKKTGVGRILKEAKKFALA